MEKEKTKKFSIFDVCLTLHLIFMYVLEENYLYQIKQVERLKMNVIRVFELRFIFVHV